LRPGRRARRDAFLAGKASAPRWRAPPDHGPAGADSRPIVCPSVDAQTEAEISTGLRRHSQRKNLPDHFRTGISAVREADESSCSTKAKIIERGNHDELVRDGASTPSFFQQQRLSEELEQI